MALRTLNYDKVKSKISRRRPAITSDSFQTLSTGTTDHHEFYEDATETDIYLTEEKPTVACCSCLYRQVNDVFIEVPVKSPKWNSLWNIGKHNIHCMFD